jgi:hypothetical protein
MREMNEAATLGRRLFNERRRGSGLRVVEFVPMTLRVVFIGTMPKNGLRIQMRLST